MTRLPAAASGPRSGPRLRGALFAGLLVLFALPALGASALTESFAALGGRIDPEAPYLGGLSLFLLRMEFVPVLLGAFLVWMLPGLVIARLRVRGDRSMESLLLESLGWSLLVTLLLVLCGGLLEPGCSALLITAGLAAALLSWRRSVETLDARPTTGGAGFLLWVLLPTLALAALAAPKIFWESATGDGAHAYEATRLLLHGRTPFFPASAGSMSSYPGPNSLLFGFIAAPLMTLFGEDIAAIRVVFFLALGLLASAMRALLPIELRNKAGVNLLIWLTLLSSGFALGWSAGYDPYGADLSLPGAQDLLLVALFVAALGALMRERRLAFVTFAFLAASTSPNGGLLLLLLPVARFLARGQGAFRKSLGVFVLVVCALALQSLLAYLAHRYWGMEEGGEHGLRPLLRKLRFIDLGCWRRCLWLVPSGIFPLLIWFRLGRVNAEARCIAITGLLAFAFFFPLLKTNLHYFAPAMLLPLAAYLVALREAPRGLDFLLSAGLGLAALMLVLPSSSAIIVAARTVGEVLDVDAIAGYAEVEAEAFRPLPALALFFAADHDEGVPDRRYGGSELAWNYHARKSPSSADKFLVVLPDDRSPPAGAVEVGRTSGFTAWAKNPGAWEDMRRMKPRGTKGRSFLLASRDRMFGTRELEHGRLVFDLREVLKALGIRGR